MLKTKSYLKLLTTLLISLSLFSCDNNAVNEALGDKNTSAIKTAKVKEDKSTIKGYILGGVHVRANANAGGDGSTWQKAFNDLQKAIDKAKKDGGIVYVAQGTYKPNSHPNGGSGERNKHFALRNNVVVIGGYTTNRDKRDKDPTKTILTGDLGNTRVLNVFYNKGLNKTSKLKYFTITKGKADGANKGSGGGMYNDNSSPSLISINFEGNEAKNSGGAIYNSNSTSNLISVNFKDNNAKNGGAMYNANKSSPKIVNSRFNNNTAEDGGGMYNDNSSPKLMYSYFTGNKSISNNWQIGDGGGGMYNNNSKPILLGISFTNNTAKYRGGGMYNYSNSSPTLIDVEFNSNTARKNGGGMANGNSSPTLTNVKFTNNTATYYGGGMYNTNSSPTLENVTFNSNSATWGGGMHNWKSSPTLTNVKFNSNSAPWGGGMYNTNSSPTLENVTFESNTATYYGGGMYNTNSSPTLKNVKFNSNSAPWGGGMYNTNSSPTLENVTFESNTATYYGGGMVNYNNSSPTLDNTVIFNKNIAGSVANSQIGEGGAIYNVVGSRYGPDSRIIGTPTYGTGDDENKKVIKVDNTYKLVKSNLESG